MPSSPTPPRRRPSSSAGSPPTMMAGRPHSSACCKACRRAPRPWKGRPMASHDDFDLIRLFGLSAEEANGLGLDPSGQPPRPAPAERRSAVPGPVPVAQRRPGAHAEPISPEDAPGIVVPESVRRPGAPPVAEGHACPRPVGEAHASPPSSERAGTERAGSAQHMSSHGSMAAAGAQGADRSYRPQADRATRESELALLAMFEDPTTCTSDSLNAPDDSGRGARGGLALADAVTPPDSKALGGGVGKGEVDMLPP